MITALHYLKLLLDGTPSSDDISDLTREDHVAVLAIRRIRELETENAELKTSLQILKHLLGPEVERDE